MPLSPTFIVVRFLVGNISSHFEPSGGSLIEAMQILDGIDSFSNGKRGKTARPVMESIEM